MNNEHYFDRACDIFTGAVIYLKNNKKEPTMHDLATLLNNSPNKLKSILWQDDKAKYYASALTDADNDRAVVPITVMECLQKYFGFCICPIKTVCKEKYINSILNDIFFISVLEEQCSLNDMFFIRKARDIAKGIIVYLVNQAEKHGKQVTMGELMTLMLNENPEELKEILWRDETARFYVTALENHDSIVKSILLIYKMYIDNAKVRIFTDILNMINKI